MAELESFLKRFADSQKLNGFGVDMQVIMPCPFCAAPGFAGYWVMSAAVELAQEHTCAECGRSAQAVITREVNQVCLEMVQTGGPDQPAWLEPKMRRANNARR